MAAIIFATTPPGGGDADQLGFPGRVPGPMFDVAAEQASGATAELSGEGSSVTCVEIRVRAGLHLIGALVLLRGRDGA